jgi:transcription elongation factor GreA
MANETKMNLGDAANKYLTECQAEDKAANQKEISRFVRWFGVDRSPDSISPAEVDNFAEKLTASDQDYARKLELVKAFLAWVKKEKLTPNNLGVHIKVRKGKSAKSSVAPKACAEPVYMSAEGYAGLEKEISDLKTKRTVVLEEMRKAAADKDFRENVPLQAAREEKGRIEGRLMELEESLKNAAILDSDKPRTSTRVAVGDTVVIVDLETKEELRYTLVSSRESNPAKGKISGSSPIGQAIIGNSQDDEIEVVAPAGKMHYRIIIVEH